MARVAALEPDRDVAVERQLVALFRDIGWIENGLVGAGRGRPAAARLAAADRRGAACRGASAEPEDGQPAEPPVIADPIAAFRAFEAWYEAERGEPFLQVFDRYMPPTPVVEF